MATEILSLFLSDPGFRLDDLLAWLKGEDEDASSSSNAGATATPEIARLLINLRDFKPELPLVLINYIRDQTSGILESSQALLQTPIKGKTPGKYNFASPVKAAGGNGAPKANGAPLNKAEAAGSSEGPTFLKGQQQPPCYASKVASIPAGPRSGEQSGPVAAQSRGAPVQGEQRTKRGGHNSNKNGPGARKSLDSLMKKASTHSSEADGPVQQQQDRRGGNGYKHHHNNHPTEKRNESSRPPVRLALGDLLALASTKERPNQKKKNKKNRAQNGGPVPAIADQGRQSTSADTSTPSAIVKECESQPSLEKPEDSPNELSGAKITQEDKEKFVNNKVWASIVRGIEEQGRPEPLQNHCHKEIGGTSSIHSASKDCSPSNGNGEEEAMLEVFQSRSSQSPNMSSTPVKEPQEASVPAPAPVAPLSLDGATQRPKPVFKSDTKDLGRKVTSKCLVEPNPQLVSHREVLDKLIGLYSYIIRQLLAPNLLAELYLILEMLTVRSGADSAESASQASSPLSTVHNCVYFASLVLEKVGEVLLYGQSPAILKDLADHPRLIEFNPKTCEVVRHLEVCFARYEKRHGSGHGNRAGDRYAGPQASILGPAMGMGGGEVRFLNDIAREDFPDQQSFQSFRKQGDLLYEIIRNWRHYQEYGCRLSETISGRRGPGGSGGGPFGGQRSSGSRQRQPTTFDDLFGADIANMFRVNSHPACYAKLASLFQEQLVSMSLKDLLSQNQYGSVIRQSLGPVSSARFNQLINRLGGSGGSIGFSNSGGPCPGPTFPGCQEFFRDFLRSSGGNLSFINHLKNSMIKTVQELNSKLFDVDLRLYSAVDKQVEDELMGRFEHDEAAISEKMQQTILILRILGKFLGYIEAIPYLSVKRELQLSERALQEQVNIRLCQTPCIDLSGMLAESITRRRLILTLPWVIEYCSVQDLVTLQTPYFKRLCTQLVKIYRKRLRDALGLSALPSSEDVRRLTEWQRHGYGGLDMDSSLNAPQEPVGRLPSNESWLEMLRYDPQEDELAKAPYPELLEPDGPRIKPSAPTGARSTQRRDMERICRQLQGSDKRTSISRFNAYFLAIHLGWLFENQAFPREVFVESGSEVSNGYGSSSSNSSSSASSSTSGTDRTFVPARPGDGIDFVAQLRPSVLHLCCPYVSELKLVLDQFRTGYKSLSSSWMSSAHSSASRGLPARKRTATAILTTSGGATSNGIQSRPSLGDTDDSGGLHPHRYQNLISIGASSDHREDLDGDFMKSDVGGYGMWEAFLKDLNTGKVSEIGGLSVEWGSLLAKEDNSYVGLSDEEAHHEAQRRKAMRRVCNKEPSDLQASMESNVYFIMKDAIKANLIFLIRRISSNAVASITKRTIPNQVLVAARRLMAEMAKEVAAATGEERELRLSDLMVESPADSGSGLRGKYEAALIRYSRKTQRRTRRAVSAMFEGEFLELSQEAVRVCASAEIHAGMTRVCGNILASNVIKQVREWAQNGLNITQFTSELRDTCRKLMQQSKGSQALGLVSRVDLAHLEAHPTVNPPEDEACWRLMATMKDLTCSLVEAGTRKTLQLNDVIKVLAHVQQGLASDIVTYREENLFRIRNSNLATNPFLEKADLLSALSMDHTSKGLEYLTADFALALNVFRPELFTPEVQELFIALWKGPDSGSSALKQGDRLGLSSPPSAIQFYVISAKNFSVMLRAPKPREMWSRFEAFLNRLLKANLLFLLTLEDQCLTVLKHKWPKNFLTRFGSCLQGVMDSHSKYLNSSSEEAEACQEVQQSLLDWISWLVGHNEDDDNDLNFQTGDLL